MNYEERKQLELLWDRNIFPEMCRMDDGFIYILDKIVIPPKGRECISNLKKVEYKCGTKKVVITSEELEKIEKVYTTFEVKTDGQR